MHTLNAGALLKTAVRAADDVLAADDVGVAHEADGCSAEAELTDVHFQYATRPDAAVLRGMSLHLHCVGHGTPTVLMENGAGADGTSWSVVLNDFGRFTRERVQEAVR